MSKYNKLGEEIPETRTIEERISDLEMRMDDLEAANWRADTYGKHTNLPKEEIKGE